jgi:ribonuclease HI
MDSAPALKTVTIYTDGSCLGNPGPGGWAAILIYQNSRKEIFGNAKNTTNNRMELTAAIEALRALKSACSIEIFTDSTYVKNGITTWIKGWRAKNLLKTGSRIANVDLWLELDQETKRHQINWHWVRAHNGNSENERADFLARNAAAENHEIP